MIRATLILWFAAIWCVEEGAFSLRCDSSVPTLIEGPSVRPTFIICTQGKNVFYVCRSTPWGVI